MSSDVAGVVLAAGASTRFGRNKLLLELEGESLVRRAAKAALGAGLDPVFVVLGHEADRVGRELSGLPVRAVVNPDYARGMNTSLAAGVAAAGPEARAAVVLLADMPGVTAGMVKLLVEEFRRSGAAIVAADYQGVHAPPTLYARRIFPELGGPGGEGRGRRVVRGHAGETVWVGLPPAALADVDRLQDWERTCAARAADTDADADGLT
jgi:molybdenum cofactor cytidylyltransferase